MAKPEWGAKRACQSCGVRYYDLRRSPIKCPACGAVFTPEQMPRRRSSAPAAAPVPVPIPVPVVEVEEPLVAAVAAVDDDADVVEVGADEAVAEDGKEKEKELIEDASDLGEDADDMSEVKEHIDEEEGPARP